MCEVFTVHY